MKAAQKLAAKRCKVWHVCACGKRFKGLKTGKHCSEACKQRAKYQRSINERCPACHGYGFGGGIDYPDGSYRPTRNCSECGGTGKVPSPTGPSGE